MSALRDTGCALVRRAPAWQAGHPGPCGPGHAGSGRLPPRTDAGRCLMMRPPTE